MSKLEELIQELCPDGVEYKPLKEISLMQRGTAITKKQISYGNIPVISGGRMPAYYCNQYNRTGETITVAGSGAGAGYVNYWNEPIFVADAFSITGAEKYTLTRYLYHYLTNIQDKIYATQTGGGVPHIHISSIENITIPIPPLEVQQEIVRILDSFTELTAELTTELTARKQQYEYYRDKLLSFDETSCVDYRPFGEVCDLKAGKAISSNEISEKQTTAYSVPCYGGNGLRGFVRMPNQQGEHSLIGRQGALCGNVCYVEGTFYATEHAVVVTDRGFFNNRFLYHVLVQKNLNQYKTAGAQPGLSVAKFGSICIPVPDMSIQNRIANILDDFDSICNSFSIGLPAEIEARQKQYEYYRDKLLTFKEKMA